MNYTVCNSVVSYYSLADVGYGVHPAANPNLIAYIRRITELMHYSNVIGIGPLEQLLLQCDSVNLRTWRRNQEMEVFYLGHSKLGIERKQALPNHIVCLDSPLSTVIRVPSDGVLFSHTQTAWSLIGITSCCLDWLFKPLGTFFKTNNFHGLIRKK